MLLVWGAYIWHVEHSVLIMLFSDDDDDDDEDEGSLSPDNITLSSLFRTKTENHCRLLNSAPCGCSRDLTGKVC